MNKVHEQIITKNEKVSLDVSKQTITRLFVLKSFITQQRNFHIQSKKLSSTEELTTVDKIHF